ncbi:MAG: SCO family protein [Gammaproteobacteria bacterium]|nr:SCO family protein [Gammaproteobacteria bacterium]
MSTSKVFTVSAVICLFLSVGLILGYALTRDKPLGEGYKLASEYGGEFTLNSDKGKVSLSDFKGKIVVIYFGFMNCQDACPVSLTKMRRAFKRLTAEELLKVQGILVSIDPKRDNVEELAAFAKSYHENVIGLVDDKQVIEELIDQYGGMADMDILDGNSLTYNVEHSSRFYMIDADGKLLTTMSYSTTPAEMVAKIREMMSSTEASSTSVSRLPNS